MEPQGELEFMLFPVAGAFKTFHDFLHFVYYTMSRNHYAPKLESENFCIPWTVLKALNKGATEVSMCCLAKYIILILNNQL